MRQPPMPQERSAPCQISQVPPHRSPSRRPIGRSARRMRSTSSNGSSSAKRRQKTARSSSVTASGGVPMLEMSDDCGLLLNASGQSVYNWESRAAGPRSKHMPAIAAMRKLGKRQAITILESVRRKEGGGESLQSFGWATSTDRLAAVAVERLNLASHGVGHIPEIEVPRCPGAQVPGDGNGRLERHIRQNANAAGACASMADRAAAAHAHGVERTCSESLPGGAHSVRMLLARFVDTSSAALGM